MRCDSRLNLLLTPPPQPSYARGGQPWHRTVTQLLVPLGVRTFEARCGAEAVELMEKHPIHLAVVDTRLPAIGGMNVLQLVQRLSAQRILPPAANFDQPVAPPPQKTTPDQPQSSTVEFRLRMQQGDATRHIHVRLDARLEGIAATQNSPRQQPTGPIVILIAPPPSEQDKQLLQEALKFNAFSVLSEPVDVNLALEVMARAITRCFAGLWPT